MKIAIFAGGVIVGIIVKHIWNVFCMLADYCGGFKNLFRKLWKEIK
jgi:hypothetical protein